MINDKTSCKTLIKTEIQNIKRKYDDEDEIEKQQPARESRNPIPAN